MMAAVDVTVQLPGRNKLSVPLRADSTAEEVISLCKQGAVLSGEYFLTADFDGFDKIFEPNERLYHLVKKLVLASGRQNDVRFYLRKKKANSSRGAMSLSGSVSSLPLTSLHEDMALTQRSQNADYEELSKLPLTKLRSLAEQRRRLIADNYMKINQKNMQLHSLLRNSEIDMETQKKFREIKERLTTEESQHRYLVKLKDELANYTFCYQSLIHQLEQVNSKMESKQLQLEECERNVDELGRLLAKLKLQRVLINKRAEISLLENEIRELTLPTISEPPPLPKESKPCNNSGVEEAVGKPAPLERPRAAVEPFKAETNTSVEAEKTALSDYVNTEGFKEALAAVEEILNSDETDTAQCAEGPATAYVVAPIPPYKVTLNIQNRQPATSASFDTASQSPPPDLIPAREKSKFLNIHMNADGEAAATAAAGSAEKHQGNSGEFANIETDKMHLRNDTLRAAKRRSWADHHIGSHGSTNDETEHIRLLLCRELKKGKTSVNLSWILDHLNGVAEAEDGSDTSQSAVEAIKNQCLIGSPLPGDKKTSTEESTGGRDAPDRCQKLPLKMVEGRLRGILRCKQRSSGSNAPKKRVHFDPLAILLDAALEGELDMVKKCASEVPNVSVCYEEGITALHNAICAGHYDVVRFLIDAGADVNAQDSDGWTPLHCAASCNNLPMAKFLVEHGACVFSTTLSDQETPADKCEESEEGFVGCSQFLLGLQERMGVLNSGKVYGGYRYEAQRSDEISLSVGDELRILSKDTDEHGWWWAVNLATGQEGYVPRNLLSVSLLLPLAA